MLINLPAVGEFNGNTPQTITSGRGFCMVVNIAYRLGIDKVVLRNASFASIVAGQNKNFDIAVAMASVTKKRDKVVDFSTPYTYTNYGVAVRTGANVTAKNIRSVKIGTQGGTTMVPWLHNVLHVQNFSVFGDTGTMFTALVAGTVDAVITAMPVILGQVAASHGRLQVAGKYISGGKIAAVYPDNTPAHKEQAINKVIAGMKADGTMKKLVARYLAPSWGGILPSEVPVWKP